jgi:hypothetical protein
MNRPGLFAAVWSIRCQTMSEGFGSSELSEMNTRPVPVAAQSVLVSVGVRSIAATAVPSRVPQAGEVNCLGSRAAFKRQAAECVVPLAEWRARRENRWSR